jgi:hypothetical protein
VIDGILEDTGFTFGAVLEENPGGQSEAELIALSIARLKELAGEDKVRVIRKK